MPGAIRTCFLCGQSKRGPQSIYMTIDSLEQERRIRDGYLKRHKVEIVGSLIDKQVHRRCYRSVLKRQPLANVRSISHPRKYVSRVKHNKLQSEAKSMAVIDRDTPYINADNSINISSDSSSAVNNDKENSPARIENNTVKKRLEKESSICLSNFQRSKLLCDLTNLDLDPVAVADGADQPSIDFSIDVHGCYSQIVGEQSLTMSNSENSTEKYMIDCESDGISSSSAFHLLNIMSPTITDSNLLYTPSTSTGMEHQPKTMTNFREIQSSRELNPNIDWNDEPLINLDDSQIDLDVDSSLFSMNAVETKSNDFIFPFTSTEKNVRTTRFNPANQPFIETMNSLDSHTADQHTTYSDSIDSITSISENETKSSTATILSRNNQRKKPRLEHLVQKGRSSGRFKRSHRSHPSTVEFATHPIGECDAASRLFANGFDELCEWLLDLLEGGSLVPMVEITAQYERILHRRNEPCTESMLRTTYIRNRLEARYEGVLHFDKLNNYEGTMVALADVSTYVRMAMLTPNVWTRSRHDDGCSQQETCETMMNLIEQIRQSIKNNVFLFRKFKFNRQSIVDFDQSLFWSCVPLLLKNFIGLLTLSEEQFQKIKVNYEFYDVMTKDLFIRSSKSLKIASISYDIINARDEKAITPKHLLLGNEIFHHTRSATLLKMTNRLGHTCGYDTILRLHQEAAEKARESLDPVNFTHQQSKSHHQNFLVKIADNFDHNPDGIHGNVNNIHILNQILVSTTENDETSLIIQQVVHDIVSDVVKSINDSSITPVSNPSISSSLSAVATSNVSYNPFVDESFRNILLGYALAKLSLNVFVHRSLPLLSGFFASYLSFDQRPLHNVSFLTPINDDPSSESTAEACLLSTKEMLLDSNYQPEAILVVDEKIYRSCVKVKRRCSNVFGKVFIYPGDFHLMKNTMVVIWDILEGSGIEEVLESIYKGASLRAVLNVHHFNKSLRSCKLVYTGLLILLLESFVAANSDQFNDVESILKELPNEFSKHDIKQKWFLALVDKIQEMEFYDNFRKWCVESAKNNLVFRLWSFITFSLFEPLIELYMSIRTCNFDARNAALSRLAPLFFSTNHRNYARLCAQHLMDLQTSSPYLLDRLSRAFAVNRTNRPFSYIALDQTIECTINKYGKSHGGIDGTFTEQTIDQWIHSFSFRALASSVMHEICQIQTAGNSIDSHAECTPQRQDLDNQDLNIIIRSLRSEDVFTMKNSQCRKLQSGALFHKDIIENICTLHERGCEALIKYIDERLIDKSGKIDVDTPLKAIPRLKLIDADSYVPGNPNSKKKNQSMNMTTIIKKADENIRLTIIIAQERQLPLAPFFAHEFCPTSLALCDSRNAELLNQQSKAVAISFIRELYSCAFHSSYPVCISNSAIVIDGGSLLEKKPLPTCRTIRDYAEQLLKYLVENLFKEHKRIDVVFDTGDSKLVKMFTKRHERDANTCRYQLKGSDKLESQFHAFVHSNRAALASCVRQCWCEPALIKIIPPGCLLVVGGPEKTAVKLENGLLPIVEDLLESDHVEADTRMMLHMNIVNIDREQKKVIVQSSDTDVALLTIALGSTLCMDHVFVKMFDTSKKRNTIIDAKAIAHDMRRRLKIDPIILLVLHALSGCDTTSFVKGITKKKFFSTFFNDPTRYSKLINFVSTPLPKEAVSTAEQLLINCYSSRFVADSLDELRANMASYYFKERERKSISANLPPSSTAFYYHCLRAARQIFIWRSSFEQYMNPPTMTSSGYHPTEVPDRFKIQWTSLPDLSEDKRLATCGQCTSGCSRCTCGTNKVPCSSNYCKCVKNCCKNQSRAHFNQDLPNSNGHILNNSDKDSNVTNQWSLTGEDEDEDEDSNLTNQWPSTSENEDESAPSSVVTSDSDYSDSDNDHVMNHSTYLNSCSTPTFFQHTSDANNSSLSNINFDHCYCMTSSNGGEQVMTPKRRKRCDGYQSSSTTTPSPKIHKSHQIITSNGSESTLSTTPQSPMFRSPRPRARFLKHFRPRLSSSNT